MLVKVRVSDKWKCSCGNTPDEEGFYPCDEYGFVYTEALDMSQAEYTEWMMSEARHIFACQRCGFIIDYDSRLVLGRAPHCMTGDLDTLIEQIIREQQEEEKNTA